MNLFGKYLEELRYGLQAEYSWPSQENVQYEDTTYTELEYKKSYGNYCRNKNKLLKGTKNLLVISSRTLCNKNI